MTRANERYLQERYRRDAERARQERAWRGLDRAPGLGECIGNVLRVAGVWTLYLAGVYALMHICV